MGIFSADVSNLRDLYLTTLEHTLNSERQIAERGLPSMIEKATNPQLKQTFTQHLRETQQHVMRLQAILDATEGEATEAKCKVTAALISEAESQSKDAANEEIRDVILIAAGNQVEHHEIAVYGTLRTWAQILDEPEHVAILEKTLHEEENADALLTVLAEQLNVSVPVG